MPSFLQETERNLPVSTTAPLTVTLYVPDSQPMLPETSTSVLGLRTKTAPAAFEPAMSLVKYCRIAALPLMPDAPGGSSNASSAYSAATPFASPPLYAFSQLALCARMAASSALAGEAACAKPGIEPTRATSATTSHDTFLERNIRFPLSLTWRSLRTAPEMIPV